jgi:hypothetical protein
VGSSLTVRPARLQDAAQMARVHVRCWQETYRGLMPDAVLDDPGFPAGTGTPSHRAGRWTGGRQEASQAVGGYCLELLTQLLAAVSEQLLIHCQGEPYGLAGDPAAVGGQPQPQRAGITGVGLAGYQAAFL